MRLAPNSHLGTYEIIASLGEGGMGELYRARDLRLGREVAIKVLPAEFAASPDGLARFEREARAVAALNHPNIVVLYSVEEEDGLRFLTMEMIEGESLASLITPGGLPLSRLLELSIPLADALVAAHAKGVVHRDLKPANVMVTPEGRVKVLDFGLAKPLASTPNSLPAITVTSPISVAGQIMGTVPYMAPEQLRGDAVDERTDLFALGALLYELATGRLPFSGATSVETMAAILRDTQAPLEGLRPDLPHELCQLIRHCLEKAPERRAQSAQEVRTELERLRRQLESRDPSSPAVLFPAAASGLLPSVAVLPFTNRSKDEQDEYFADGMTEAVIAQLCKARTLKVISRSSVMPFKTREESLKEIAARLSVASVLEGSIRRVGDQVRIAAQLIDADSGQHLWADTYDRQLTDIFGIQTDVALHIAAALQAELSPRERGRIRREPTRDMLAYEHYLRGRHCLAKFTLDDELASIGHFQRAIERDPEFAQAYVGLSTALTTLGENGALGREQAAKQSIAAAEKAVSLDPELGEAHVARAYARMVHEFDWTAAEAGYKRALELSPGSADAYDFYGRLCAGLERFDEALVLHRRAHELDPLTHRIDLATTMLRAGRNQEAEQVAARALALEPDDARLHATFGWALFRQGRVHEGIKELERAATLMTREAMWLAQLGQAYGLAGRTDEARETLRKLEDPSRPSPVSPYHLAWVYAGLGEAERAMDCLERAFKDGSGALFSIKGSFLLAPVRHHPRFIALLERMRLA